MQLARVKMQKKSIFVEFESRYKQTEAYTIGPLPCKIRKRQIRVTRKDTMLVVTITKEKVGVWDSFWPDLTKISQEKIQNSESKKSDKIEQKQVQSPQEEPTRDIKPVLDNLQLQKAQNDNEYFQKKSPRFGLHSSPEPIKPPREVKSTQNTPILKETPKSSYLNTWKSLLKNSVRKPRTASTKKHSLKRQARASARRSVQKPPITYSQQQRSASRGLQAEKGCFSNTRKSYSSLSKRTSPIVNHNYRQVETQEQQVNKFEIQEADEIENFESQNSKKNQFLSDLKVPENEPRCLSLTRKIISDRFILSQLTNYPEYPNSKKIEIQKLLISELANNLLSEREKRYKAEKAIFEVFEHDNNVVEFLVSNIFEKIGKPT